MSRNDIENMSAKERIALMEEIWASFDRDDLEYPVPQWHKEVLAQRAKSKEKDFISLAELKKSLQAELNDA